MGELEDLMEEVRCDAKTRLHAEAAEIQADAAPDTSVSVDQVKARAKLLAKIDAVVERPGSGTVES